MYDQCHCPVYFQRLPKRTRMLCSVFCHFHYFNMHRKSSCMRVCVCLYVHQITPSATYSVVQSPISDRVYTSTCTHIRPFFFFLSLSHRFHVSIIYTFKKLDVKNKKKQPCKGMHSYERYVVHRSYRPIDLAMRNEIV